MLNDLSEKIDFSSFECFRRSLTHICQNICHAFRVFFVIFCLKTLGFLQLYMCCANFAGHFIIEWCFDGYASFAWAVISAGLSNSDVVRLSRPPAASSMKITDRSFQYMPRLISGINFLLHFVNQFHLFVLISTHPPSLLHFLPLSPLHSFTLNSKLTFLVNPFCHRFLTIDTPDYFIG